MRSRYASPVRPLKSSRDRRKWSRFRLLTVALISLFAISAIGVQRELSSGMANAVRTPDRPLAGNTFVVTKTADTNGTCNSNLDCSLREAINAANDETNNPGADTISFKSGVTGKINLSSPLPTLSTDISIQGPGAGLLEVTRASSANFRIFLVWNGSVSGPLPNVSISGLSITNGSAVGTLQDAAGFGGGIANDGKLTISNCVLDGNTANRYGGAIQSNYFAGATLSVNNCTFSNNTAGTLGGEANTGGALDVGNQATITNSTFVNNKEVAGSGLGGALSISGANVTVTNCTFNNNSAATGGAISNLNSNLTVSNSTLSGNSASAVGGGIYNNGTNGFNSFVTVRNTILQKGASGANLINDGLGTLITSQGFNLSSDNGSGFLTAAGDQINTNPQLGPLQDNGGPTQTMAPLPSSTALDKGKSFGVTTDQRGRLRPADNPAIPNASGGDGADIGAVELEITQTGPAYTVTTTADHDDGTCGLADCTLREAIHAANTFSGPNTILFDTSVIGTISLDKNLGTLIVSDSTTINGPGAASLGVSGVTNIKVFAFTSGINVVSGLTIRDGFPPSGSGPIAAGGVSNALGSSLSFTDCVFVNNRLLASGGGATPGANGNTAAGGAIANSGVLSVTNCTFNNNEAIGGNGAANTGLPHVGGAGGAGLGGAIYNDTGASLFVTDSTFFNNAADGGAGGPNTDFGGGAGGVGLGGAIANAGTMSITACTINGNPSLGGNGGNGRTVVDNGAAGKGNGGIATTSGTSTVRNSIVAGNTGNHGGAPDADGAFSSGGYNLIGIGDGSSGFSASGDQVGTNGSPLSASLGPLQNNGGQTQTMALLSGSLAIDKGKAFGLITDQRGLNRTFNSASVADAAGGDGTDIGAFEVQGPPPTPTPTPTPNVVQFSAANYSVVEDCTTVTITVNRIGDTSGAASVDYATSDLSATERRDYIRAQGTLNFAAGETSRSFAILINEDSYVEGNETFNVVLSNAIGVSLGGPSIAIVTIIDDPSEPATNPIDDPQSFVCQHYHDFLNRQPDQSGLAFWTNEITSCNGDPACIETKRINVSAAFYLSIEFQQTGYLVERIYKTAYGSASGASTFPSAHQLGVPMVRLNEFLSDTQRIGQGVVVGHTGWEQQLENNKQSFTAEFVQRTRFTTALGNLSPTQLVDVFNANAGNPLSLSERNQLVSDLSTSAKTKAQALRTVAEHPNLVSAEFNNAFVLMQFFGYLRRNPNDPQDSDYTGYDFWLTKLNQFGGNYQNAEMVKAFITSIEYRQRFGP